MTSWVVYRMTLHKGATGGNVVCEQSEWDEIEAARPGFHALIRAGIPTEQEAEKLARGTAGDGFRGSTGKTPPKSELRPSGLPAS